MKKLYTTPSAAVFNITAGSLLTTASQGVTSDSYGIDYGGVDDAGTKVPGTRRFRDVWDETENWE